MTHSPDTIVITSCTSRKKKAGPVLTLKDVDNAESLAALALTWRCQVASTSTGTLHQASNLYGGRSMSEAKRVALLLGAPLYIISAGHGVLCAHDGIPSYDVTVTAGSALHRGIVRLGDSPTDWWHALIAAFGRHRSLGDLFDNTASSLVLLAVPSVYLRLLADELASLSDDAVRRLRIFTSALGASTLPERLQLAVMPYDERLEGLHSFAGTRSDFPQRALRHFIEVLEGHTLPADIARKRIGEAMQALRKPVLAERRRLSDEEILLLLRQNWNRFNGCATVLLRFLRDEALVACEQSRFRTLRQQLLSERDNRTEIYG